MKWWISDYQADTGHLGPGEHGAYLMLMLEAWKTPSCSLPADPAWLKRRLRFTDEEYALFAAPVIAEFWTEEDHRIYQKRQRAEFEDAAHRSEMAKKAANLRWSAGKVISLKTKETD